jgi:hypothetical protein
MESVILHASRLFHTLIGKKPAANKAGSGSGKHLRDNEKQHITGENTRKTIGE